MELDDLQQLDGLRELTTIQSEATWYDVTGALLNPSEFMSLEEFNKRVEFVTTWDGYVLSKSLPEWAIVHFIDPISKTVHAAPGFPLDFYLDNDGEAKVLFRWLKEDSEADKLQQQERQKDKNFHLTFPNILLNEDSELTLRCYACCLRTANIDKLWCPDYDKIVIPLLTKWLRGRTDSHVLGCWSSARNGFETLPVVDVFDTLELYSIHPRKILRTRLATMLWNKFVSCQNTNHEKIINFLELFRNTANFDPVASLHKISQLLINLQH